MENPGLLIPVKKRRRLGGEFAFGRTAVLTGPDADRTPLGQLAGDLSRLGVTARVRTEGAAPGAAEVCIRRDSQVRHPEGYRLTVRTGRVELLASTAAGAYYGVQTLRELLGLHGRRLPGMRIDDEPDLARRAVYHDCARGKVPKVATVCALIERLARWKINELQLYIENGFRFRSHPDIGRGYSPFSPGDILKIQDHCRRHHVRFVGSLASFGHMEKILALPAYRHLAEGAEIPRINYKVDLCPIDPGSIRLVADLYGDFLPLQEARDFNACCDETWEVGKGRSRRRAAKIGIGRLYWDFVLKLYRLCREHGKRMNIWGDIVLNHPELIPEIPKDVVMLNWDYKAAGKRIDRTDEFVAAGLPLMCCPGVHSWGSHGTRMAAANANIVKFARIARNCGAEGLLNTDWGDSGHRNTLGVSLHGFALGAACAWGGGQVRPGRFTPAFAFHVFGDRTGRLAAALQALGDDGGSWAYHALIEPLDPNVPWGNYAIGHRRIDSPVVRPPAVRRRLAQTSALGFPRLRPGDEFETTALAEFDIARRMDALACRRALAARDLRAGKTLPARLLRSLAEEMRCLSDDFAAIWRVRNRPSRLRDSLKAMRATIAEAEGLAR